LDRIGLGIPKLKGYLDETRYSDLDLTAGYLTDKVSHGVAHSWAREMWGMDWVDFFAQTNLSASIQAELASICAVTKRPDGIKYADLADITVKKYIEEHLGLSNEATRFAELFTKDWFGVGADQLSAAALADYGPGFDWAGTVWDPHPESKYLAMQTPRFPDGFHTIVRGLLAEIKPEAFTRTGDLEELFLADICPDNFDRPNDQVQLRLRSMAVHVEHDGDYSTADKVTVHYLKEGEAHRVYAKQLIMAGGGFAARRVLKDLPSANLTAAEGWRHCPMVYANVALRRWQAIADAKVQWGTFSGERYQTFVIQQPIYPPGYSPPWDPDKPITAMLIWPAIDSSQPIGSQL
ncbi:MAG: hypothetical protein HN348_36265, partial [Proteobacteria bacterium]|nr:hypothetical protein [Pseudomonadota bacterium]